MPPSAAMQSYAARLATFTQPHQHQPNKRRRASSQSGSKRGRKEKESAVVEWPHELPSAEDVRTTPPSMS